MKHRYISAEEIEKLFYAEPKRRRLLSWKTFSVLFLLIIGVFVVLNGPAYWQQLRYWWESDIQAGMNTQPNTFVPPPIASSPGTAATPTPATAKQAVDPAKLADNTLYIPKIRVSAPIIWDVTKTGDINADLIEALRSGIARYPQTALPNQIGNVFLTGHSSNYWWEKGRYKTVFALLDRLVVGDVIYVKYQGLVYTYKVKAQRVVSPTETSVLDPTTSPILSLMTCTPTGTTLYRRIVTASLVSPLTDLKQQSTQPKDRSLDVVR